MSDPIDWTAVRSEPLGSRPAPVTDPATAYPAPVGTPNPRAPKRRTGLIAGVVVAVLVIAAGGGATVWLATRSSGSPAAATSPVATHAPTPAATVSPSPSDSPSATVETPAAQFPPGYPKVVNVTSLPSQVKNWYQISGYTKAVALAPGVWTPLPAGATVDDAAASGPLDGYCASITAYERQYLNGEERGGACW